MHWRKQGGSDSKKYRVVYLDPDTGSVIGPTEMMLNISGVGRLLKDHLVMNSDGSKVFTLY